MKFLLLDKDGTLVKPKSGHKFVQNPEDQELLPGVMESLALYRKEGYIPVIVTNQGGVAAGYKSLQSAIDEVRFCMQLTGIGTAMLAHSYEEDRAEAIAILSATAEQGYWQKVSSTQYKFRKPEPGMLLHSAEGHEAIMVGDRPEDEQAASAAGFSFLGAEEWRT